MNGCMARVIAERYVSGGSDAIHNLARALGCPASYDAETAACWLENRLAECIAKYIPQPVVFAFAGKAMAPDGTIQSFISFAVLSGENAGSDLINRCVAMEWVLLQAVSIALQSGKKIQHLPGIISDLIEKKNIEA